MDNFKAKIEEVNAAVPSNHSIASYSSHSQNQLQQIQTISPSHPRQFKEEQCQPIQEVATPQTNYLIAQSDLYEESLSFPKLIVAVGLAKEKPYQQDLQSIQKKIKLQREAIYTRKKQKEQKQAERERQRFQPMQFETPECYLKRIKIQSFKGEKQSDDSEDNDYGYYYNKSRIQFNRQQSRRFT